MLNNKIFSIIGEILVLYMSLWCIHFVSLFVHELGHAAGYILGTKDNNWMIEIGLGKKIIETSRFRINLFPTSGDFYPKNEQYSSKKEIILMLLGGPIASLLSAVILVIIKFTVKIEASAFLSLTALNFLLNYALVNNLILFITSSLPFKKSILPMRGYVSDAYKIRKLLSE